MSDEFYFEDPEEEVKPLISRGRYNLPDPITGNPRTWMRTTNFIDKIQDLYAVRQWEKRKIIEGLALRKDLYAEALTYAVGKDIDTRKVNDLAERCKDAAGANEGARIGTMLHKFTDRHDRGEETHAPPDWADRIRQYALELKMHRLTVVHDLMERTVVNLTYGCAGTFDRGLMEYTGKLILSDLKSETTIYGYMSKVMQFGMYTSADFMWDEKQCKYVDMPPFDQDEALMLWLPSGGDGCEVHWVDLRRGQHLLKLCADVYFEQKEGKRVGVMGGLRNAPSDYQVVEAYARRLRDAESVEWLTEVCVEAVGHGVWCEELEKVAKITSDRLTSQQDV